MENDNLQFLIRAVKLIPSTEENSVELLVLNLGVFDRNI